MTSITLGAAATPVAAWSYDNLGQRTGITRGNGVTTSYVRDNASYLTSLTHNPSGTAHDLTLGFTWSPAGQALSRSMSNAAYAFAPVNATTAWANNGLNQNTVVGGATLAWSPQGNLTSDGARTFTYDAANRLTGTTGSALTYDPLDRLYQMTGAGAGRFQYDGSRLAAVYPAGSTTVAERYVGGPDPDEWVAVYTGAGTAAPVYPLQNHQGSVIALTDAAGAATSTLAYDEYGRPRAGNLGRFQYTGQMMLPDYGLQHYKARAYHAALGRFVQTDPVGYEQGMNLYAYVGNDPINLVDPLGTQTQTPDAVISIDGVDVIRIPGTVIDFGINVVKHGSVVGAILGTAVDAYQSRKGDDDASATFFHGTDVESGLSILNGNLSAGAASSQSFGEQEPGFYMTPDANVAEFFAARRSPGTVLSITMTDRAVGALTAQGSTIRPMNPGGLQGARTVEFLVPPRAFNTFNSLRSRGEIVMTPYSGN